MLNDSSVRDLVESSRSDSSDSTTTAGGGLDQFRWNMYNAGAAPTAQGAYEPVSRGYIGEDTAGSLPEIHFVYPDHGTKAAVDNAIKSAEEQAKEGHTIKKGDTLWAISRNELEEKLGRKPTNQEILDEVNAIVKENNIADPNNVPIGTHIRYPKGES